MRHVGCARQTCVGSGQARIKSDQVEARFRPKLGRYNQIWAKFDQTGEDGAMSTKFGPSCLPPIPTVCVRTTPRVCWTFFRAGAPDLTSEVGPGCSSDVSSSRPSASAAEADADGLPPNGRIAQGAYLPGAARCLRPSKMDSPSATQMDKTRTRRRAHLMPGRPAPSVGAPRPPSLRALRLF